MGCWRKEALCSITHAPSQPSVPLARALAWSQSGLKGQPVLRNHPNASTQAKLPLKNTTQEPGCWRPHSSHPDPLPKPGTTRSRPEEEKVLVYNTGTILKLVMLGYGEKNNPYCREKLMNLLAVQISQATSRSCKFPSSLKQHLHPKSIYYSFNQVRSALYIPQEDMMKYGPGKTCHKLQPLKTLQLGVTIRLRVIFLTICAHISLVV